MSLAIIPVGQIFGKYEQQARIAELNRKTPVKTIQNQADRVTISPEARKAQVLGIARAVRDASKQLSLESKSLDGPKSVSVEEADNRNLQGQAEDVRKKVMQKAIEIKEKAAAEEAAKKKEQYEREATP
ncbi:uncharacterized protein METZ01_LOCUS289106, partial [marine metagenome]